MQTWLSRLSFFMASFKRICPLTVTRLISGSCHLSILVYNLGHSVPSRIKCFTALSTPGTLDTKIYKRLVKKCKYKYEQDIIKRLTDIEKSNPREFWKSFKQLKDFDKSHKENPIPPSEWVTHFHSLLNIKPQIDSSLKLHIETFLSSNVNIFNELNYRITNVEISCVINSLKSGKSPGVDSITNEMIRCGWTHLQEYFITFFNSILTSGTFPSPWFGM